MKLNTLVLVFVCLILLSYSGLNGASESPREFAPVQGGFTKSGKFTLPYAPNRVIIKFTEQGYSNSKYNPNILKSSVAPGNKTGIASLDAIGLEIGVDKISRSYPELKNKAEVARLGIERWFVVELAKGADVVNALNRYRNDPNIEYARPDLRAFPAVVPSDPLYPDNWGHNNTGQLPGLDWGGTYEHTLPPVGTPGFDVNAELAWSGSQGYGSSGVIVAIIDTGVDTGHPDLSLVTGYDFGDNDTDPDDDSSDPGHGTCCAGIATANVNNGEGACGSAPDCRVMPLKVADSEGNMYFSYIEDAIYYAADNGADIISLSLGAPGITSYRPTDDAIEYAYNAGVTILAAAGNENDSTISYPAVNPYVISVGAASPCGDRKRSSSLSTECNPGVFTDPNGYTCDGERWWGSNYGVDSQDAPGAVDILSPTIMPATDIVGSGGFDPGDYAPFFNGTSCSTPYAAGICALIKSANPSWTPAQIRAQLTSTAIDIINVESASGWDRYSGYGMIDAAAALNVFPPAPVAAFSGSPASGCAPLSASFTDESTGDITSWSWNFGDGGTSDAQSPGYIYNDAGVYTVTLTVTGPGGSDDEIKTEYITVGEIPSGGFTVSDTSGAAPLTVDFTDISAGNPDLWHWDFGDDSTSTVQNPSHTYTSAGTYTVVLHVQNSCGADTVMLDITATTTTDAGNMPLRFGMRQNYPNPFNPLTTIEFTLTRDQHARLDIFDVSGRLITTLVNREMSMGLNKVVWRADRYSSGVYFAKLTSGGNTAIRRLILLR